jgi:hypothetical protein
MNRLRQNVSASCVRAYAHEFYFCRLRFMYPYETLYMRIAMCLTTPLSLSFSLSLSLLSNPCRARTHVVCARSRPVAHIYILLTCVCFHTDNLHEQLFTCMCTGTHMYTHLVSSCTHTCIKIPRHPSTPSSPSPPQHKNTSVRTKLAGDEFPRRPQPSIHAQDRLARACVCLARDAVAHHGASH